MSQSSASENFVAAAAAAGFARAPLSDIQSSLARLFSDLQGTKDTYSRTASTNVLIPLAGGGGVFAEAERLLEVLARLQPSRIFLYSEEAGCPSISAQVTARCHLLGAGANGKSQHVCSEVVCLDAPLDSTVPLQELLRANFVTGTPTELVLADSEVSQSLVGLALPLCEQIIMDSAMWISKPALLEALWRGKRHVLDLQWVALGPWRETLRQVFDLPDLAGLATGLKRIEVRTDPLNAESLTSGAVNSAPGCITAAGVLLLGWIVSRLGLSVPVSTGSAASDKSRSSRFSKEASIDCQSLSGNAVRLALSCEGEARGSAPRWLASADSREPKIRALHLSGIVRGGKEVSVRLEREGDQLRTVVRAEGTMSFSRPIEDEGGEARLRRYYLIGESTANYPAASHAALQILKFGGVA